MTPDRLLHIKDVSEKCKAQAWWWTSKSFREVVTPETVLELLREIENLQGTVKAFQEDGCAGVIPGTFIMCGEGSSLDAQYCSTRCQDEANPRKGMDDGDYDDGYTCDGLCEGSCDTCD